MGNLRYIFVQADITDNALVKILLTKYHQYAVINFAGDSHADRSIHGPGDFVQTNIFGTLNLLESVCG
jgi:dTDP-glucose 4,6-dehydratase